MKVFLIAALLATVVLADKPGKSAVKPPTDRKVSKSGIASTGAEGYSAAAAANPAPEGTQGYYYYYYPVEQGHEPHQSYQAAGPSFGAGLGALIAGKLGLIVLVVGGLILLGFISTTLNAATGRSLYSDLSSLMPNNLDDLTDAVTAGIEFYKSVYEDRS